MDSSVHETTSHSMYGRGAVPSSDPQSPRGAIGVKTESEKRTLSLPPFPLSDLLTFILCPIGGAQRKIKNSVPSASLRLIQTSHPR